MSLNSPSPTLAHSPEDQGLSRGREGSAELDRRSPVSHGQSPSPSPLREDSRERNDSGAPRQDEEAENQGNSIHCGGLPRDMTEDELREKLGAFGRITSCSIPYDPHTHESRGFGFVTFATVEEANRAVDEFTDTSIRVQKSRRCKPRAATPGRYLGRDRNRERRPYDRRYRDDRGYDRYESRRGPSYDRYPSDRDNRRYDRSGDYDRGYDRYDRNYERGPRYDDRRSDRGGRYGSPSYSRDRRSPTRY